MKINKLKEALIKVDEVQLLELLDISAEDLVERFEDKIIARRVYLAKETEQENLTEPIKELDFN